MGTLAPIQLRRGLAAYYTGTNPVLKAGEPVYTTDTHALKIGDGGTAYNDLPQFATVADVADLDDSVALLLDAIDAANELIQDYTEAAEAVKYDMIVSGAIVGDNLVLTAFDGTQSVAGNVRGPQGAAGNQGPQGTPGDLAPVTSYGDLAGPTLDLTALPLGGVYAARLTGSITEIVLPPVVSGKQQVWELHLLQDDALLSRTITWPTQWVSSYGLDPVLSNFPGAWDVVAIVQSTIGVEVRLIGQALA